MAPLAWVRRIAAELPELNPIPLFGNAPPFDWSQFSLFSLHPKEQGWKEPVDIAKGLGASPLILPISVSHIGAIFWIMSRTDMGKLTSSMMKSDNDIVREGFYRYLALEALQILQEQVPFKELTLQLSEEELPTEKAFCIDVSIKSEGKTCWGRLAIPAEFRSAWVRHFSSFPSEYFPTEAARQTELTIRVKTGSVTLRQEEWESIKAGDFVLLDMASQELALVMLQTIPLFNAKIKPNQIELVDYAFTTTTHEETMENTVPPQEEVIALKELPLNVTVEIGRLQMTLDQLMHLTPGNTLDLPIHPDQNVSLTINGRIVGKAELVYLGEQLGIRVLEI